ARTGPGSGRGCPRAPRRHTPSQAPRRCRSPPGPTPPPRNAASAAVVLEQDAALFLQRALDDAREHAEHRREQDLQVNLGLLDVDRRFDAVAERPDREVELVAGPAGFDLRAARDMLVELMDIVGDPPPRLVFAEAVREV